MDIKQNQRHRPQMKSPVKLPIKYKTKGPSVLPKIPLGKMVVCTELERETIAVTVNPEGPTDTNYRYLVNKWDNNYEYNSPFQVVLSLGEVSWSLIDRGKHCRS